MSSPKYFNSLNYSLGNEDTGFEVNIVNQLNPKNILSIAGCGSRALPLLSCQPDKLVCVDLVESQLAMTRLRMSCYLHLNYDQFLIFWGFPPYAAYDYSSVRRNLFSKIELSPEDRTYFAPIFEANYWNSILYLGKWEKTFQTLSKGLRFIMGKDYNRIFNFHSLDEQIHYYENEFPQKRWDAVLFLLGNKAVFNALLYKGDFIKKNVPESHFEYYQSSFDHLFRNGLVRNSFFANLCFFGEIIHQDGNTIEAESENFHAVKSSLESGSTVLTLNKDLLSGAKDFNNDLEFVSLSDVPSYFSGEIEKSFSQQLLPSLCKGAIVVLRSYLRIPEANWQGYTDVTTRYSSEIANEKVQMYRIQVFEKL